MTCLHRSVIATACAIVVAACAPKRSAQTVPTAPSPEPTASESAVDPAPTPPAPTPAAPTEAKDEVDATAELDLSAYKPRLHMSSDSLVCKKAMKCCEDRVAAETGTAELDAINLQCSGVGLAKTDKDCALFAKGYAMSFSNKGKAVPVACQ